MSAPKINAPKNVSFTPAEKDGLYDLANCILLDPLKVPKQYKTLSKKSIEDAKKYERKNFKVTKKWLEDRFLMVDLASGDARLEHDAHSGFIYFIADVGQGLVKIGVSGGVHSRVAQLRTATPGGQLLLLGCFKGSKSMEKGLHAYFDKYRVHGEWFKLTKDIAEFIKLHTKLDPDNCPVWQGFKGRFAAEGFKGGRPSTEMIQTVNQYLQKFMKGGKL